MAFPASISVSREHLASSSNSCSDLHGLVSNSSKIFGRKLKSGEMEKPRLRLLSDSRSTRSFSLRASMGPSGLTQQLEDKRLTTVTEAKNGRDMFNDIKDRFLSFKKNNYLKNIEQFQNLATGQAPKFMVIACADSRVCPSNILGFQPGEAFTIRNVANLVPPFESGPSETNAALEFAVNSLKVENIIVIGHSCCGGIRALMSMQDDANASFIKSWVVVGKNARIKTEATASSLNFDQKCRHCEKESVNNSLSNLLTYPWIETKVATGELSIHGGYYDFTECTFEKWTLDYKKTKTEESGGVTVKDRIFWS
ncbi:beta carbonic anhydrase 5, chloroplastic-like [Prosopis cineraria]|uniref:beta carbonic anhydrase 5, chloroplastic-like n=1 Tax=Prosopis cineraria TaxID=364024 RepID=UPI00240FDD44|nr:beta carbonic anhydrase 5, chloroplastic-like [Prosopis cineraria]